MKTTPLCILAIVALSMSGCALNSGVVPLGGDRFMITRQAATGFSGSGRLKAKAIIQAEKFCASRGKTMKVVAITEAEPPYVLGNFPKAEIVFDALDPNDPRLRQATAVDPSGGRMKFGEKPPSRIDVNVNQ